MKLTLFLPEGLVRRVGKIAVNRGAMLTVVVRQYLSELVGQKVAAHRKRRELEVLERSFEQFQFGVGNKSWTR